MSLVEFLKDLMFRGKNPFATTLRTNRLRPPGAVPEERFMALCIRCNRCLEVCPYGSIRRSGPGPTIGTPYVYPERRACYLCMACCRLCPTGALDRELRKPEKVTMGKASIDPSLCYSRLFFNRDKMPEDSGDKIAALCNTCYNVCPLPDRAIALENNLYPIILDDCVGCGICAERCPTRPRRAINVRPAGMNRKDEAGFYFRKAKEHHRATEAQPTHGPDHALHGRELIEEKARIDGAKEEPEFSFPYEAPEEIEGWE